VINQANTPKRPEIPSKDFAETMGTDPIAVLPFDPALFGQAANNGQMLIELQPKAAGSEAVRRLARTLTGRTAAAGNDKQTASLFSFLKTKKQA
jgi:pilus assembly protein CpaE